MIQEEKTTGYISYDDFFIIDILNLVVVGGSFAVVEM